MKGGMVVKMCEYEMSEVTGRGEYWKVTQKQNKITD